MKEFNEIQELNYVCYIKSKNIKIRDLVCISLIKFRFIFQRFIFFLICKLWL